LGSPDIGKSKVLQPSTKGNSSSEKAKGQLPKRSISLKDPTTTSPETTEETSSIREGEDGDSMKSKVGHLEIPVSRVPVADPDSSDGDIWTKAAAESVNSTAVESGTPERTQNQMGVLLIPSEKLPVDIGTSVLDIQTKLRSDFERFRLEITKQFISFKDEMGKKWNDEVEQLREESLVLEKRVEEIESQIRHQKKYGW
jgi:hypothetical protein